MRLAPAGRGCVRKCGAATALGASPWIPGIFIVRSACAKSGLPHALLLFFDELEAPFTELSKALETATKAGGEGSQACQRSGGSMAKAAHSTGRALRGFSSAVSNFGAALGV